jgi:UDP:flavonoid glycosyltransferase YjiC (YdhE family)
MSRILLTWELGLNLGHLTRLLPLAQRLKADGHTVLVAARDIQAAATVLTPAGIPFVQSPHLAKGFALAERPAGYADVLLSQGWIDRPALRGLTHAWLNLLRLFNPQRVILDYSPTVSLAARIAKIPTVLVGNGFELPPASDPLPPFPGFSWATAAKAATSERIAVENANSVLGIYGGAPLTALRDLVAGETRLLATFPELDHYGERSGEHYIGPLLGALEAPRVEWPPGEGPKIFACLRPDSSHAQLILATLVGMAARVICVVAGFTGAQLAGFKREHIRFSARAVDLQSLGDADLCLTYGAEGTMLRFLLMGVPQLISPWHVETFMAVSRVEAAGFGTSLKGTPTVQSIADLIRAWTGDRNHLTRVKDFARGAVRMEPDRLASLVMGLSYG